MRKFSYKKIYNLSIEVRVAKQPLCFSKLFATSMCQQNNPTLNK